MPSASVLVKSLKLFVNSILSRVEAAFHAISDTCNLLQRSADST